MEMLPGAVQVLIEWFILLIATLGSFFQKLKGGDDTTAPEATSENGSLPSISFLSSAKKKNGFLSRFSFFDPTAAAAVVSLYFHST